MKILLSTVLMASSLLAQTNPPPQKNKVDEQQRMVQLRSEFIRKHHPLRVINGTLYDFTPFFVGFDKEDETLFEDFRSYVVHGKVLQVLDDGILVDEKKTHLKLFLINWRYEGSAFDGSSVETLAVLVGRHQYTATSGARSTVIKYDCGHFYNPDTDSFTKKKLILRGSEKEMPVSEPLDIAASKLAIASK